MKLNDAAGGALLALLGAPILWHVQGFPRIPGQNVGPGLFPGVLAVAMLVCGAILIATGLNAGRTARCAALSIATGRKAPRTAGAPSRWAIAPEWLRSRRHVIAFAVLVASNVFYLL